MSSPNRFANIGFDDFRRLATDESLSNYERIGFPDSYRDGFELAIFADIRRKLTNLESRGANVLDIGPGCSGLPAMLIDLCNDKSHQLVLVDSAEMLDRLPNAPSVTKVAARYPDCPELIGNHQGLLDAILCYSVLQYVVNDGSVFSFLDSALSLLAPGGQMLIGDIPNVSKRKRFFSSAAGVQFHKQFMQTMESPDIVFNQLEHGQIDDAVVFSLLQRARLAGFDAYVMPQDPALPMGNRREDILIVRP
ncbi:class I SAM-dependent methyltransferase [Paraburkholderia dipogonis]|uniref:SAM-dependent methyltransferase n=1 Tax=Paraburkholderia dipogonis TaxID=1211383 RepID=UPI0038BD90B9